MTQTQTHPDSWRDLDAWEKARLRWLLQTSLHPTDPRPNQLTPPPDAVGTEKWLIWLVLAGRGFGKTRMGAEDISEFVRTNDRVRVAVVADTYAAGRDVCIEGESGLISVLPPSALRGGSVSTAWNRSLGELIFANDSRVDLYAAEKPDQLRGPQHHRAWCEELAKWRYLETWDQLMFGLRLGAHPQAIITTTPRPLALLLDIASRPGTVVTRGSTFDNERNLAPAALAELRRRYEGTRLGQQELYAELLADFEGALWTRESIVQRAATDLPELVRIAVGVDPSTWGPESGLEHESTGKGIETGIVVVGMDDERNCYVLDDLSLRASPNDWAKVTIKAFHDYHATAIVPEKNVGGWVVSVLTSASEGGIPVTFAKDRNGRPGVSAIQGKRARAEPVAALYEQGRVFHVGRHPELEDAMCSWDPRENWSPDRVDALVWAITWLEPWMQHSGGISSAAGAAAGRLRR